MAEMAAFALERQPLPADVRLMNGVATAIFVLVAVGLLAAAVQALARWPGFALAAIRVDGELSRNSVATIRANATPQLSGNFFSLDLARARAAFESVPWVRQAVVRRVWPNRLAVQLEEHHPVALWEGELPADGGEPRGRAAESDRIVNSFGEVFQANVGDVEDDALPVLAGPDGSAAEMLRLLERLQPALAPLGLRVERLVLSRRGSWRAELDSGAVLQLGRGADDELLARVDRFVRTLPQIAATWPGHPLELGDLRHEGGYAVRLRGVTTQDLAKAGTPGAGGRAASAAAAPRKP